VAFKRLDAHDGGNCNQLGLYIDWYPRQIDCNQLGLCIDEYIVESIAISSDCVLMDVDGGFDCGFNGGFDGGFDGGFNGQFHLAVLGYQTQQNVWQLSWEAFTAIDREDLTGSLLNELVVLQTRFTGFVKKLFNSY
jgi:hypothetical protein